MDQVDALVHINWDFLLCTQGLSVEIIFLFVYLSLYFMQSFFNNMNFPAIFKVTFHPRSHLICLLGS